MQLQHRKMCNYWDSLQATVSTWELSRGLVHWGETSPWPWSFLFSNVCAANRGSKTYFYMIYSAELLDIESKHFAYGFLMFCTNHHSKQIQVSKSLDLRHITQLLLKMEVLLYIKVCNISDTDQNKAFICQRQVICMWHISKLYVQFNKNMPKGDIPYFSLYIGM